MNIILVKGGAQSLVDEEDFGNFGHLKWYLNNKGYVYRSQYLGWENGKAKNKRVQLHRLIMNAPKGSEVDHINGDPLDNRRSNLRFADESLQGANRILTSKNTSGYPGVSRSKSKIKPWRAEVWLGGKHLHLGHFFTKEAAFEAYKQKTEEFYKTPYNEINPRNARAREAVK